MRVFIFPKWGDHRVDVAEGGAFWRSLEPRWPILEFLSPGVLVVSSPFWRLRAPLGWIFWGKSLLDPSGEIQAYPFPRKINFPDFYWLLNQSWYQMGRGREVSFNSSKCLSALVKIFPCGRFKKFKTNRAVLTIIMSLENIFCWNLVKSALDREDSSVPLYSSFFNFCFICNFSVWCVCSTVSCPCGL